jgi:hypothetical protein
VAAGLEKARASRAKKDEDPKPDVDDVASDEAAASPVIVAPPA